MEKRRNSGLIGRARRGLMVGLPAVGLAMAMVSAAPAEQAFAQANTAGSIDIGGSIAATVAAAVSGIATNSGSTNVTGSVSVQHSETALGEEEGTAVSDASGGNRNVSLPNG
jgi:hypothetical protein